MNEPTKKQTTRELLRVYVCQMVLYQDAIARELNLTASDMKCLRVINCYGPMTPGELARKTGFTTGGITKILDHLEAYGAIQRSPAADRRTLTIESLSPGHESFDNPDIDFDATIEAITESYNQQDTAVVQDFLKRASAVMQEKAERLQSKAT